MIRFGVDIGGSGIKAAPVDTVAGRLTSARNRIPTPHPPTVSAVLDVIADLANGVATEGPVGVTFPGVVRAGVIRTAANLVPEWIGVRFDRLVAERLARPATVLNDADAAGLAEVRHGAARDVPGVVLMLTFGTGIGSALFIDGRLVPNTELGHLEWHGVDAEKRAAASVKTADHWSWKTWAHRASAFINILDRLFSPDLVVIGGGLTKNAETWLPLLEVEPRCVPAALGNDAGIIGAACHAAAAELEGATSAAGTE